MRDSRFEIRRANPNPNVGRKGGGEETPYTIKGRVQGWYISNLTDLATNVRHASWELGHGRLT